MPETKQLIDIPAAFQEFCARIGATLVTNFQPNGGEEVQIWSGATFTTPN